MTALSICKMVLVQLIAREDNMKTIYKIIFLGFVLFCQLSALSETINSYLP